MESQHPEIAAKWRKKGHAYVAKAKSHEVPDEVFRTPPEVNHRVTHIVRPAKKGMIKPLLIGVGGSVVGGAVANQIPRVVLNPKKKKVRVEATPDNPQAKLTIEKAYDRHVRSDDPDFNHDLARKTFDLIMKMDDDTAEMYSVILVGELFENDIEKNLGTLQRHLDEVITKQLENVKKAHLRLVSKGMDPENAVAYAQALSMIESVVSKKRPLTPYEQGYQFEEKDFRRDPGTGRFQVKITEQQTHELHPRTAHSLLGTNTPKKVTDHQGNEIRLSEEDRIRFQDEYRQLANFLGAVSQSAGGSGNQRVLLQYRDKRTGEHYTQEHIGRTPPKDDLANPHTRLVGAIAKPETLTAGGAAFGLAGAMGGSMTPQSVASWNAAEQNAGTFTNQWLSSGDPKATNAKLYGRTAAAGQFLGTVGPPGSKTQLAGKVAQIVGQAGPEAEKVLGPTSRKTAYRYRGTEKAPEKQMVRAYAQGVDQGKLYGEVEDEPEPGHGVRDRRRGKQVAPRAPSQMGQNRTERGDRAPSWSERELGRRAVVDHLRSKMPKKELYELQLASGNTPPSEGVIINADGQVASQAVGYGDDHYLPFNLKNLKALKGGEYIRTRSVGGLTSEDIYTGLISGARQVTVTSRSGTYTMEFEPDFRGGRRHNDKARRMTRRYEQILDAVQSQQVDRMDIDPMMREEIEREVKEEMPVGPGSAWRHVDQRDAIQERIDEFKENPYITEQDEKRAEVIINARSANASEPERAKIRAQVMDDLMDQKETKFRLNSAGYKASLDALHEQFPYYIKQPRWTPPKDSEKKIDTTLDRGYVEPGRNRPTAAAAGLFGVASPGKFHGKGGKFSAREADYQGASGKAQAAAAAAATGTAATESTGGPDTGELTDKEKRAGAAIEAEANQKMVEVAKKIQERLANIEDADKIQEQINYTEEELTKDPVKFGKFATVAQRYLDKSTAVDPSLRRAWEQVIGHRDAKPFNRAQVMDYPKVPPKFEQRAYVPGADKKHVTRELDRLDREGKESPYALKPYSAMTEDEYRKEHNALVKLVSMLEKVPGKLDPKELEDAGLHPTSGGIKGLRGDKEKIMDRMELIQRSRALTKGFTDEQRAERAKSARTVVHNETKTDAEYAEPAKKAIENADLIDKLRRHMENKPTQNDDVIARLQGMADAYRNAVANNEINAPEDLKGFKETHEEELEFVEAMLKRRGRESGFDSA